MYTDYNENNASNKYTFIVLVEFKMYALMKKEGNVLFMLLNVIKMFLNSNLACICFQLEYLKAELHHSKRPPLRRAATCCRLNTPTHLFDVSIPVCWMRFVFNMPMVKPRFRRMDGKKSNFVGFCDGDIAKNKKNFIWCDASTIKCTQKYTCASSK